MGRGGGARMGPPIRDREAEEDKAPLPPPPDSPPGVSGESSSM